jgi:RNA polymerase sigma-70 factor (ECF subfamily)
LSATDAAESGAYADRVDAWLVEQSRDRADERAFAELVRRYRQPVFRLAVSILGQGFAADAEDVAQDVMVRAHRSLGTFRGDAAFSTWIYRVTFNHAISVKSRVRFRAPHVSESALDTVASPSEGPADLLQSTRRRQAVLACLGELPEVYQSAVRLHYWLGASMREISEMLEVPENTVKSYLHRARLLLRAHLTERGFDA